MMTSHLTPATMDPKRHEKFYVLNSILRRVPGFKNKMGVSRAIASGKLKLAGGSAEKGYFIIERDHIAQLNTEFRRELAAQAAGMSAQERQALIAELAQQNAELSHNNATPSERDYQLARERVADAVYNGKLDTMERVLDNIAERLTRLSGLTCRTTTGTRLQLRAERIDTQGGVIKGATVAQAGVRALGKFFTAPDGKKYPVFTDSKTLETLMAAAARDSVKTREDHVDKVGSRAGYSDNFRRVGDRVIADVHLFDSYSNRAVVLETADKTPDLIGLSIDFDPDFEVIDDRAFIRVRRLEAVDIVDAGAITHSGLL